MHIYIHINPSECLSVSIHQNNQEKFLVCANLLGYKGYSDSDQGKLLSPQLDATSNLGLTALVQEMGPQTKSNFSLVLSLFLFHWMWSCRSFPLPSLACHTECLLSTSTRACWRLNKLNFSQQLQQKLQADSWIHRKLKKKLLTLKVTMTALFLPSFHWIYMPSFLHSFHAALNGSSK